MPTPVHRDVAVLAYAAACLLAVVQTAVLGAPGRTLVAAVPYAAGLAIVLCSRAGGPATGGGLTPGAWRRLLGAVMVVLAAWATVTFLLALPGQFGEPHDFYRIKVAVTTPLGDHNTVAGLLLVGVVVCAGLAAEDRRWLAGSALVTIGLVATLSRGAVAVLVVVALVGTWLGSWRGAQLGTWLGSWRGAQLGSSRVARTVLAASAALALAGVLLATVVLDASPPPGAADPDGALGASVVGRADLALRGVEVGLANPLLGAGLGSFAQQAPGLPPPNDHAHQLFAHAFAEGGVVLLLVALILPSVVALRAWRASEGPLRDVALLGGAALVGHAQLEILGGRLGYELVLAALAGALVPRVRSAPHETRTHR